MEQLTIRIPKSDVLEIEQIAKRFGLKNSDITRMAIKKFIEKENGDSQQYTYERVKHLIGVSESGISDLGQNHRKHLLDRIKAATR